MGKIKAIRVCRKCGLQAFTKLDLGAFVKHSLSPHGYTTLCTNCKNEHASKWRRANRGIINKKRRIWRKRLRQRVINAYGGKCKCCGESELGFLSMDHIDDDGKQEREKYVGSWEMYSYMMRQFKEDSKQALNKYQVLCYNCNLGRYRNNGICPHKYSIP